MDNKILTDTNIILPHDKRLVLIGGCFDILHEAHREFIKKSKELGDILIILLESDENIKKLKGENRPINNQSSRANTLKSFTQVDYIVLLKPPKFSDYYYNLVKLIRPDIIAITDGDPLERTKRDQANSVNGKLVKVMKRDKKYSTTSLIK